MDQYHPDQAQDLGLISETLVPILQALSTRLDAIEERLAAQEDLTTKIVTGFHGAAQNHRKSKLLEGLTSKYGSVLEPIKPFYQELVESDPIQDLLNAVMGLRDQEGYDGSQEEAAIENMVQQIVKKFGNLRRESAEAAPTAVELEVTTATPEAEVETNPLDELRRKARKAPRIM